MKVLEVSNLSKVYRLYRSPMERVKEMILRRSFHTEFNALREISFCVLAGETFGIIGENGAGKSTLLKIIARTLKPTSGEVVVSGRIAALLELGAGFNPELTGEENIYLNAYLMGLSKEEVDAKREEIIAFSELEDFIGRPVKTYSSGMYVRLAFSIATSVDPEILIVDEALSVGDEYFQKKCVDRMMAFRERGKTILFCSHSMYYVQELCQRVLWLHKGEARNLGTTGKVIMEYQNHERSKSAALREKISTPLGKDDVVGQGPVRILDLRILNKEGNETMALTTAEPAFLSFRILCGDLGLRGHIGFALIRNDEVMCFGTTTQYDGLAPLSLRDQQAIRVKIPSLKLLAGMYTALVVVADEHAIHPYDMQRSQTFTVTSGGKEFGVAYMDHEWVLDT